MTNLERLRVAAGYTQEQAASELGVDRSTIAKWEASASFPRSSIMPAVAHLYRCTISDLFESEEPESEIE